MDPLWVDLRMVDPAAQFEGVLFFSLRNALLAMFKQGTSPTGHRLPAMSKGPRAGGGWRHRRLGTHLATGHYSDEEIPGLARAGGGPGSVKARQGPGQAVGGGGRVGRKFSHRRCNLMLAA